MHSSGKKTWTFFCQRFRGGLTLAGYTPRMLQTIESAHDVCNCTLTAEMETEEFCSPSCKDDASGGIEMDACNCGHPPCDVQ
jgi:hypothetical protein